MSTNRTVLEYRVQGGQARGRDKEPWTWVRTHGKGRVFYTAWGHDQRTFGNPGFQNLVERGIRWACGQDPSVASRACVGRAVQAPFEPLAMTEIPKDCAEVRVCRGRSEDSELSQSGALGRAGKAAHADAVAAVAR